MFRGELPPNLLASKRNGQPLQVNLKSVVDNRGSNGRNGRKADTPD